MADEYKQFNCYEVLKAATDASPSDIKNAYKKMSLTTHPDSGGSHDAQIRVNLAYEVLSNPIQRQAHDIFWKIIVGGSSNQQKSASGTQSKASQERKAEQEPMAAFKKRLEDAIQSKKGKVWVGLDEAIASKSTQFLKELSAHKKVFFQMLMWAGGTGAVGIYFPLLWIATAWLAYASYSKMGSTSIGHKKFPLFDKATEQNLRAQANHLAAEQCHSQIKDLDNYMANTASIFELAMRSSSFDDSEVHVVRRLTVALFLMGYIAESFDNEQRMLLFSDGDEKLVVRFRHRTGPSINITYVQKLYAYMGALRASHGILFCSPGLSGNAAQYAASHKINSYTLESMNEWVDNILKSNYAGPPGDIIEQLNTLNKFISRITPKVSGSSYGYRRSRRRYRRY